MKIKIISNPYEKNIRYFTFNEFLQSWEDIKSQNPNSRLREDVSGKGFLPFQIKEIVDIIISEYYTGESVIELFFEGTKDELDEVVRVCAAEDVCDKIQVYQSEVFLENARLIFDDTKEIFEKVKPIIERTARDNRKITKNLNKVSEALNDVIPICVFGNYSAGKSTFINALIGSEILPSGGDPVTAKVYKIMESTQNDVARIRFELRNQPISLLFEGNTYRVLEGDVNSDLLKSIADEIPKCKKDDLASHVNVSLELINSYEKKDREVIEISNLVDIEVPFSVNGILGQSKNNFVIFDTPGSNSASNVEHSEVLAEALEDFSNGIPVWVSQYESIDSEDNANLCEKIFGIRALDKRFTMIILNKADGSDLDEEGFTKEHEREILEYKSVEKMYAGGIYFVSSIMGLGAKNNGELVDKHYRKIYRSQQDMYSDPEDEDYATLYKYNIMPSQIKDKMIGYSLDCSNLIYANSGLLAVEMEMESFATKHSAYNKCYMVYDFLNDVIDETNKRIDERTNAIKKVRARAEEELDDAKNQLIQALVDKANELDRYYTSSSKPSLSSFVQNNNGNFLRDFEWINAQDMELRNDKSEETNFDDQKGELEDAKTNMWNNFKSNGKNLFKGHFFEQLKTMREDFAKDRKIVHDNKESVDNTEKEIDKETADKLIRIVVKEYKSNIISTRDVLSVGIEQYWHKASNELKNHLLAIVTGTAALSQEQRDEVTTMIVNYQAPEFPAADDLFIKRKYLKGNVLGIKFGASERINTKKLLSGYNDKISKNVSEIATNINNNCISSFGIWKQNLLLTIEAHITEYNPQLRELVEVIRDNTERIQELEENQQTIGASFAEIKSLISWKVAE